MLLPGGEALDDLPWVLTPGADDSRLAFTTYGSHATAGPQVYLAVDPARSALEVRSGVADPLGPVHSTERYVFRIEGEAWWREPGNSLVVRLRTGVVESTPSSIGISGPAPSWAVMVPLATLGAPDITRGSSSHKLLWRPCRAGIGWMPLNGSLPEGGEAEVALSDGDALLDRRRVVVLPAGAKVTARTVGAMIEVRFDGLAEDWSDLPGCPGAEQAHEGAAAVWRIPLEGPAPAHVLLRTRHRDGLELRHSIQVPMLHGGFVRSSGQTLAHNRLFPFADLPRIIARAGANDPLAELEICAKVGNSPSLGRILAFVEDLPLSRLRADLQRLHTALDDPDAELRLSVLRNGMSGPCIRLRAFDRRIEFACGGAKAAGCALVRCRRSLLGCGCGCLGHARRGRPPSAA